MNRFAAKYRNWTGTNTTFGNRMSVFISHELKRIIKSKWSILVLILTYALIVMPRIFQAMTPMMGFNSTFYFSMYDEMFLFIILYAAVVGSGIIASDFKDRSIVLYLTKGYSRKAYILGKFTILFLAFSLITILPLVIIYSIALISSDLSLSLLRENLWILGAGLAMGTFITVFLSTLTAGLSSLLGDRRYTGASLFAISVLSGIVADVLFSINGNDMMWMASIMDNFSMVGSYLFRLDSAYSYTRAYPFLIILGISVSMSYMVYHYIFRKELRT